MKTFATIIAASMLCFGAAAQAQVPKIPTPFVQDGTVLGALFGGAVDGLTGTLAQLAQGRVALNPTLNGTAKSDGATVQGGLANPLNRTLSGLLATDPGRRLPRVLINPAAVPSTVQALGVTLSQALVRVAEALVGGKAAQLAERFESGYSTISSTLLKRSQPLFDAAQPLYDAFARGATALPGLGSGATGASSLPASPQALTKLISTLTNLAPSGSGIPSFSGAGNLPLNASMLTNLLNTLANMAPSGGLSSIPSVSGA